MSTDYSEIFCTAVDEIVSAKLAGLEYDITKTCTIIDDSNKKTGKYRVSSGAAKFDAYAVAGEYSNGETVLVTIPNGNYDLQKIIIGRSVAETKIPTKYTSPLSEMTQIKDYIFSSDKKISLLANEIKKDSEEKGSVADIYTLSRSDIAGFTKLGISAKFKAWLLDMDTSSGEYGLKITLKYQGMVAQGIQGSKYETLYFTASDMIGNPYAFESYYTQEKVFDISHINKIDDISVQFYQRGNFKDSNGTLIPYKDNNYNSFVDRSFTEYEYEESFKAMEEGVNSLINFLNLTSDKALKLVQEINPNGTLDDFCELFKEGYNIGSLLEPNLFVKDVKIHFGYAANIFTEDNQLVLYTPNELTYHYSKNNDKNIYIRWTRKISDGLYEILDKTEINYDNYEIRWFQENVGYTPPEDKELDPYAGPNWEPIIEDENQLQDLECLFVPRAGGDDTPGSQVERIKAIAIIKTKVMNGFKEEESIQTYNSNILTFENEEKMPDDKTFTGNNTFKIVCRDGSEGSYLIYNQSGKINNIGAGQGFARYVDITYQDIPLERLKEKLNLRVDWIKWYLPLTKTMLLTSKSLQEENEGVITYFDNDQVSYYEITRVLTKDDNLITTLPKSQQGFSIKNQWNYGDCNNTIRCSASINGVVYNAAINLRFGKAGTNGTNQTFVIECLENKNALVVNNKGITTPNTLTLMAHLYDMNGIEIELTENQTQNITWSWYKKTNVTKDYILLPDNKKGQSITLTSNTTEIKPDNYYIIQADYTSSNGKLTTYFPVPMKTENTLEMQGAREIIYNSQGNPSYYTDAYILYYLYEGKRTETNPEETNWNLTYSENFDIDDEDLASLNAGLAQSYLPRLKSMGAKSKYVGLSASPMYASGFDNKVCVSVYNSKDKFGWSQPILILKSAYDFPMLNEWDGTLTMNEKNGTILSTMLGAGRKNPNNTFSGVLMGDITQSGSAESQLGVYGIHEGEISYSLKEDGTATFGKSGRGQIHIDGNKGTIKSGNYTDNKPQGMKIDLDDGIIDIRSSNYMYSLVEEPLGLTRQDFIDNDYYTLQTGAYVKYSYKEYLEAGQNIPDLYIYDLSKAKVYISPGLDEKGENVSYFSIVGKSGGDIIKIAQDEYCLQSENWIETNGEEGSKLSLNNGKLDMKSEYGNVTLSSDGQNADNPFFAITSLEDNKITELFHCSNDGYYLQSLNYQGITPVPRQGFFPGKEETLYDLSKLLVINSYLNDDKTKWTRIENQYIGFYDSNSKNFYPIKVPNKEEHNISGWKKFYKINTDYQESSFRFQNVWANWYDEKGLDSDDNFCGYRGPNRIDPPPTFVSEADFNKSIAYYTRDKQDKDTIDENELVFKKQLTLNDYNAKVKKGDWIYTGYTIEYALENTPIFVDDSKTVQQYTQHIITPVSDSNNKELCIDYSLSDRGNILISGQLWDKIINPDSGETESNEDEVDLGYRIEIYYREKDSLKQETFYYPNSQNPSSTFSVNGNIYNRNFYNTIVYSLAEDAYDLEFTGIKVFMYKSNSFTNTDITNLSTEKNTFTIKYENHNGTDKTIFVKGIQWIAIDDASEKKYSLKGTVNYSTTAMVKANVLTQIGRGFRFDLGENKITSYDLKLSGYHEEHSAILDFSAPQFPLTIGDKFKVDWNGHIVIQKTNASKQYDVTKYLFDVIAEKENNDKTKDYKYKFNS